MHYFKQAFDPENLEHAKHIVLTPDAERPNKFKEETALLVKFVEGLKLITPESLVLDFGCGMGRVSKNLIETFGCKVIGTDMSEKMLQCAAQYVGHPDQFVPKLRHDECNVDVALSCFVLQHAEDPVKEISQLHQVIKPGGHFVVLEGSRLVPIGVDAQRYVIWYDDHIVIKDILADYFENIGWYDYVRAGNKILSVWKKP